MMVAITRDLQKPVLWTLLNADDVMLANEGKGELEREKSKPIILEEENDSVHQNEPSFSEDTAPEADVPPKNSRPRPSKPRNDEATRFDQCSVSVAMPENSEVGTLVTTLKVLNRKNWTMIDMVNPDGTFDIRQNTGEVFVRDNRIMDRELFTNLELVAEIHGSSHLTECSRIRVNVELLDENDNKPAFEKEKYVFILANEFPVDGSIGIIRARDIDEGEAGRVSYRILNDSVPFEIRPKGKDAEIIVTSELNGIEDFHLIIEAQDNAPPFLSSQIPVDILIQKSKLRSPSRKTTKKKKISGVTSATSEPVELEEATASEAAQSGSATSSSSSPSTSMSPSWSSPSTAAAETTTTQTPPTSRRRSTTTRPRTTTQVSPTSRQRVPSRHVHPTLISEENLESKVDSTTESPESEQSGEEYTSSESEEVRTTVAAEATFDFVQPAYYYEVFGAPHEGDVLGRVEARPRAQFYGVDRKARRILSTL
ncbi:unnamed protein product [Heligmosomoides polygyrus]|uniref:CA domain-containing protein n=1 Tax=Heligmosomoides polygyrus TaxID=6339 RepID=A0A3P7ZE69_HELPZ|nr:unnamed protein product [Heligmosomoides polygyrus]